MSAEGKVQQSLKEDANFQAIPVMVDGKVVGRFIELNGNGIYVDYSNYTKEIKAFNVKVPTQHLYATTSLDTRSGKYIPSFQLPATNSNTAASGIESNAVAMEGDGCRDPLGFNVCNVGCGISALAIAASDGPAPFMDVLAVSYMATCTTGCGLSWCERR